MVAMATSDHRTGNICCLAWEEAIDNILARVRSLEAAGQRERALALIEEQLPRYPQSLCLPLTQAHVLLDLGRFEEAKQVAGGALRSTAIPWHAPGSKELREGRTHGALALRVALGIALRKLGEHDASLSVLSRALKDDRKDPAALYQLACTLDALGRSHDALAQYIAAIASTEERTNTNIRLLIESALHQLARRDVADAADPLHGLFIAGAEAHARGDRRGMLAVFTEIRSSTSVIEDRTVHYAAQAALKLVWGKLDR
ncbi:tetratricopeptide repeat protein [Candidatus Uhrbacteria bacterium]|nr:tetratricopeptide repeat protein [Candidatus Uhrbacteria bacterium]